ncbi:hypothetical protein CEXT_760321 [Caerostris extrusa]|uniref:Uncharacterized protein n=1 Tax=Caerostris extrusa TaxID=172846 RepID=A0AAV4U990_CAEEX|nr:hypothetical protein CEXT_760321 [Caerostris extrusa]
MDSSWSEAVEQNSSGISVLKHPHDQEPQQMMVYEKASNMVCVSLDGDYLVAVADRFWCTVPLNQPQDWIESFIQFLKSQNINELMVVGLPAARVLKPKFTEFDRVMLDGKDALKYACRECKSKSCAVVKAYYGWRRTMNGKACHLPHGQMKLL